MARRLVSKDILEARSRFQKHGTRVERTRNQRLLVILACEGKKTEFYYFQSWFEELKERGEISNRSCVIAPHAHTNPKGVLGDLKSFRSPFGGWKYSDYEHRWIVIDRDEERTGGGGHTLVDFNQALISAKGSKPQVDVAWSNPCFEIWYLLHFHYHNTPIDRDRVQEKLSLALGFKYQKNDPSMQERLQGLPLETAVHNAKKLEEVRISQGLSPADANPGTTVYQLVSTLRNMQ